MSAEPPSTNVGYGDLPHHMTRSLHYLEECEAIILLLTKNVLKQPECLYAAYQALVEEKLLIPINIERGGE